MKEFKNNKCSGLAIYLGTLGDETELFSPQLDAKRPLRRFRVKKQAVLLANASTPGQSFLSEDLVKPKMHDENPLFR